MYTVYILRTNKDTLYIGQTNDLEKRLSTHTQKKGAKYLRSFESFTLVYQETYKTRSEALKREYALKQLSKAQKERLLIESR